MFRMHTCGDTWFGHQRMWGTLHQNLHTCGQRRGAEAASSKRYGTQSVWNNNARVVSTCANAIGDHNLLMEYLCLKTLPCTSTYAYFSFVVCRMVEVSWVMAGCYVTVWASCSVVKTYVDMAYVHLHIFIMQPSKHVVNLHIRYTVINHISQTDQPTTSRITQNYT